MNEARIAGVSRSIEHGFSKQPCERVELVAGLGVADDAHAGATVQHISRMKKNADQPNPRGAA
jgi:hypothetical protein